MKKEIKSFPFEIKSVDEDEEYFNFSGYASTFGNVDLGDDVIIRGAFSKSLEKNANVPILANHNMSEKIGDSILLKADEIGLYIEGILPKSDTLVSGRIIPQMKSSLKAKRSQEMSIGYITRESYIEKGIRILKEIELFEVSLVTKAMNPLALVSSFKSIESIRDVEQSLKEMGLSSTEAKTLISKVKEFSNQRDASENKQREADIQNKILENLNNYIINNLK